MAEVTASDFKNVFEQVTQEQMNLLLSQWSSQPRFTAYVKGEMMPRVAHILGCDLRLEHPFLTQRIDIVLAASPSNESNRSVSGNIVVAVEHENTFGGSYEETIKLRDFRAPLNVMITYVGRQKGRMIREYGEILSKSSRHENVHREILVIIGPYGMTPPAKLNWEYFVYQGDGFQKIE